jgi:hypothetical protein
MREQTSQLCHRETASGSLGLKVETELHLVSLFMVYLPVDEITESLVRRSGTHSRFVKGSGRSAFSLHRATQPSG